MADMYSNRTINTPNQDTTESIQVFIRCQEFCSDKCRNINIDTGSCAIFGELDGFSPNVFSRHTLCKSAELEYLGNCGYVILDTNNYKDIQQ